MRQKNNELIDELLAMTGRNTQAVQRFLSLDSKALNYKEQPEKWSVLECMEHLNRYGEFYLPEIEKQMLERQIYVSSDHIYRSGFVGNAFANMMRVRDGKVTRMRTMKDKDPSGSSLTALTLERFLKQQEQLTRLLGIARTRDLTRTTVPITLTRFIRLRLGDTLRFFIYHIERHVVQAENALRAFEAHHQEARRNQV